MNSDGHLIWRFEAETFFRSTVQFIHNSLDIFPLQICKVHSFGEVPMDKSVCISAETSHPFMGDNDHQTNCS